MRLYSKNNKDYLFDIFDIHLILPTIKWGKKTNEDTLLDDSPTKYLDIKFDTRFILKKDNCGWFFQCTFLGFGIMVIRQDNY